MGLGGFGRRFRADEHAVRPSSQYRVVPFGNNIPSNERTNSKTQWIHVIEQRMQGT